MQQHRKEWVVWKNARLSVVEGGFYAVMVALGESFIIPCALFYGMRPTQIAILATLPPCLGGLSQFLTPWIEQRLGRRKFLVGCLMVLQIAGLTVIGLQPHLNFLWLLLAAIMYWVGGDGLAPIWAAWMIPEKPSHKVTLYHANRGTFVAFVSFLFFMLGGFIKTRFTGQNFFQMFFLAAAVARLCSMWLLLAHVERRSRPREDFSQDLTRLTQALPKHSYVFALIGALVIFRGSAGIASPHFTQYMLGDLGFTYMTFTFLVSCGFLGRTLLLRNWIKTSHKFGSTSTLIVCCLTISVIPLLWLVSHNVAWLAGVQAVASAAWVGCDQLTLFILASLGLRYWSRYLGLVGMLGTFGALLGGWWGGWMLESGEPMATVLYCSSAGRLVATIALIVVFKFLYREVLKPMKFVPIFFSTLSLRPSMSNINKLFWRKVP